MFLRNVHRWVYICFGRFFARWSRLVQWIREVSGNDVHFCLFFFSLSSLQLTVLSMLERVTEKWSHECTRARRKRMPLPHCPRGITSHSLVPEKNFWPNCLLLFYFFDLRSSPFPSHWCFMYGCQRLNIRNCCSLYISRSRWEKMPFHSRFLNDYQLDVFFVRFSILCQHDRPYASISEQRTPLFYLECVGFVCWCLFIQFWTRWAFL